MTTNKLKRIYNLYIERIEKQNDLFKKSLSLNTIRNYKHYLSIFIGYVVKDKIDISKIDLKISKYLINKIVKDKKYGKNTANLLIRSISGFFKYLIDEGKIGINPFKISIPRVKNENKAYIEGKKLSKKQVEKILMNSKGKNRDAILLMYCFGLRISEIDKIKREDFSINGIISLVVRQSKGNSIRKTYCIFKEYEEEIRSIIKKNNFSFRINYLKVFINRLSKRLGIPFSSHSFRHSFANEYLNQENSGTLEGLKSLLGHSSILTTEQYGSSAEIRAEKEVNRMLS